MQEYRFRSDGLSGSTSIMVMGGLQLACGIFVLFISGLGSVLVGAGILVIIVGFWQSGRVLMTLHEDHLDMKIAPMAAHRQILYEDITDIDDSKPKQAFLVADEKRVMLPKATLTPDDWDDFVTALRQHVKDTQAEEAQ